MTIKVSSKSNPNMVAGAIAGQIREIGNCDVSAIGAAAINQSVKAIAIARSYLLEGEGTIVCIPSFVETTVNGEDRTAIKFEVQSVHIN